jgi:hypothetical protein
MSKKHRTPEELVADIRPGDTVTIKVPSGFGRNGQEYSEAKGRAVMGNAHSWALNMGGRYGKPGIADAESIVSIRKARKD